MDSVKIKYEPLPGRNVLVVDDLEVNLYVAEKALEPYEMLIDLARSGFEAIDKIKVGNVYDVIFMDHIMPKMDGVETVARLRDFGYTGTIVALTANAIVDNGELYTQNGFDGFFSKPIDLTELNAVLDKFIRNK